MKFKRTDKIQPMTNEEYISNLKAQNKKLGLAAVAAMGLVFWTIIDDIRKLADNGIDE